MKTIEQLEKEFDEADLLPHFVSKTKLKNYIFQELLPQVLSEMMPKYKNEYDNFNYGYNVSISRIKQKAKEMGINLPE